MKNLVKEISAQLNNERSVSLFSFLKIADDIYKKIFIQNFRYFLLTLLLFFFSSCSDNGIYDNKNLTNTSDKKILTSNIDDSNLPYLLFQGDLSQNASELSNREGPNPPACSVGIFLSDYELASYYYLGTYESDTLSFTTDTQNPSYPYCGSVALDGKITMAGLPTKTIYNVGYKIKQNSVTVLTGVIYTGQITSEFNHNFSYSTLSLAGESDYTLSFYISGNQ